MGVVIVVIHNKWSQALFIVVFWVEGGAEDNLSLNF